METRKIYALQQELSATSNKDLFGQVSPLCELTTSPIPLLTAEAHQTAADIIRQAKHEVLMVFYKFASDSDGGKEILVALKDLKTKAEQNKSAITVRLLVNSRGYLAQKIYKSNYLLGLESLPSSDYFNFKLTLHETQAIGSLHSKYILVDAKTALICSADPHQDSNIAKSQFDSNTLLRGSVVATMRNDFQDIWNKYSVKPLEDFPLAEVSVAASSNTIPCLFISKKENGNPLSYTGSVGPYKIAFLTALKLAHESIHIVTSNLNDPDICTAIADACERNVNVYILIGKHHNEGMEAFWGGTNHAALAYIVSKVSIDKQSRLHLHWNTDAKGNIVEHGQRFTLHAKVACIDNELVFAGSSPLDKQAMYYSREADIIFEDKATAKAFIDKFFKPKFNHGKDYFEDAYKELILTIAKEANRIGQSATKESQITKALGMQSILHDIDCDQNPIQLKVYNLLALIYPYLEIRTGLKPGMPQSYNSVYDVAVQYGLDKHQLKPGNRISVKSDLMQFSMLGAQTTTGAQPSTRNSFDNDKKDTSANNGRKKLSSSA